MPTTQDDITRKTKSGAEVLGDDVKQFGSDAATIGSSIGSSMGASGGMGSQTMDHSGTDLHQMSEDMKQKAQSMMSTAKVKGAETMQQLQSQVRSKPAAALGIAAGVGLLVGLVMAGRR